MNMLNRIPLDKLRHYLAGSLAAALGGLHSVLMGALLCAALAIGKELRDHLTGQGTPEWQDLAWTLAGGAVTLLPLAVWRSGVLL